LGTSGSKFFTQKEPDLFPLRKKKLFRGAPVCGSGMITARSCDKELASQLGQPTFDLNGFGCALFKKSDVLVTNNRISSLEFEQVDDRFV
jgi:hypothetical protein